MAAGSTLRLFTVALAATGLLAILAAGAWWWVIFGQVMSYGYLSFAESVGCLGSGSDICDLAMALCGQQHTLGLSKYSPNLLWIGVAILFGGLFTGTFRRRTGA